MESKATILVVDDEQYIRRIVERWLKEAGYACRTASTVDEADEMLKQESFELVVSDILMPGRPGSVLVSMVRDKYPETSILVMTAIDDELAARSLRHEGASGYLVKPLDRTEMLETIERILRRRDESSPRI